MLEPLQIACGNCAQQPGEECIWAGIAHPRFHAERIEAAAIHSGGQDIAKPELVDAAFRAAVNELF